MWKKIILTIFLSILAVGIIGENVLATQYYQIIDIGTLSGAVSSYPSAINNNGQVVGFCGFIDETTQAFIWQDYTITNLGGLPGRSQSRALGINDMEQIVGDADTLGPVYDRRAVLFDSSGNGANVDLGTLGGVGSTALGNNNSGQIVGISKTTGSSSFYATLFDSTGNQENANIGIEGSRATDINNNGEIVGFALNPSYHAMVFEIDDEYSDIDLGTLVGGTESYARSINDLGQIVGHSNDASGNEYATLFDVIGDEQNVNLGSLGGDYGYTGIISYASDINNLGQIVGYAVTASGERHATLFNDTGSGINTDLNTLIDPSSGWTLNTATSINDSGWIVGLGINSDGFEHGYLLVPEPCTLSLITLGTIALLKRKRRK